MKKLLLLGMLVVSGLAFGRDYEYRESMELQPVERVNYEENSMISREREAGEINIEAYQEFHRELINMDRGTERN
ncbi:hypothetical protein PM10SUCC1_33380 [Propionigenium maris DSM 9537]|uniref:Uncharacterized protein n=1 Tax=Propionigenium maris DSM 9537 TaxID=1123000 RepID=A0A9W6GPQ3_9FUSO|nr:hypothetical protein [Propionigenium maris]GLI57824.1 hypothetical protein PM10SUCC1_33380 [Propionigenium maris DSM 9537]